jgi:hypothetical protein
MAKGNGKGQLAEGNWQRAIGRGQLAKGNGKGQFAKGNWQRAIGRGQLAKGNGKGQFAKGNLQRAIGNWQKIFLTFSIYNLPIIYTLLPFLTSNI